VIVAALLWVVVAMQIVVPPQQPPPPGSPIVVTDQQQPAPAPSANASAQTGVMSNDQFAEKLIFGTDKLGENFANGMFDLLRTAWGLPSFLTSRPLDKTVEDSRIVQLNTATLVVLPGLILAATAAAGAANLLSIRHGRVPSFDGALVGYMSVLFAAIVAAANLLVLRLPIDVANLIFEAIGAATIRDYAESGLTVVKTPVPIGGVILALVYFVVMAFLTYVLFKELIWCGVLLAQAGLWMFAWLLPWSVPSSIGGGLGMKFIGTVFSPALALGALRLAAPTLNDFSANGVDVVNQLMRIMYAVVAYEAPAIIAGAIAVRFPSVGDAYLSGRAVGLFRPGARGGGGGGGGGGGASAAAVGAAEAPRAASPGWAGSATGKQFVRGGRVGV
jgi:hypothetical protein